MHGIIYRHYIAHKKYITAPKMSMIEEVTNGNYKP